MKPELVNATLKQVAIVIIIAISLKKKNIVRVGVALRSLTCEYLLPRLVVGHQALAGEGEGGENEKLEWRELWLIAQPCLPHLHCKVSFVIVFVFVFGKLGWRGPG